LECRWCARSNAAAGSQADSHTRWRTAVAPPHVHSPVSSLHRPPQESMVSGAVARPTSADFVASARLVMMSRRTYPNPHLRRLRPHTSSSWCDCPTPEPIQLRALRPDCGPLPLLERSFASGEDVSDVTDHRGPRPGRLSREEVALESLRPRRLSSCRSRCASEKTRVRSFARSSPRLGFRLRSPPGW